MERNENIQEVGNMALPIFRIPKKKYAGETTVVSLRLPKDLLREIDEIAKKREEAVVKY